MDLAIELAREEAQLNAELQTLRALSAPFWVRRKLAKSLEEQIWHRRGAIQAARRILESGRPNPEPTPVESVKAVLESLAPEVTIEPSQAGVVKKLTPEDIAALIRAATAATSTGSGA